MLNIEKKAVAKAVGMLACALLASPAAADDAARIKELERKLERSMQLIENLSAKVSELEKAKAPAPAASPAAADQQARVEALERQVAQLGSGISHRSFDDGIPVHGFADVGLAHSGEHNPIFGKGRKGFNVGSFDLYLTPQFGDRVRSLIELVFEVDHDGDIATDLERLQIGYAFSDAAVAWGGRFHTPYGYWNTAFHHGAQIQTSLSRPRFLEFEDKGGILPAHTTGAWLTGALPLAGNRFGYDVYVGNSSSLRVENTATTLSANNAAAFNSQVSAGGYAGGGALNMKMAGGDSGSYMTGFNAWIEPRAIDGLRLGVHGLGGSITDDSADRNRTRLAALGAYGVFASERWEVLGEFYRFNNRDLSGGSGSHRSWAGYLQAGYNSGRWMPYVRGERASLEQKDNYFAVQEFGRSYRRFVAGLRYDLDPKAALKLELSRTSQEDLGLGGDDRYGAAQLQYSIRF